MHPTKPSTLSTAASRASFAWLICILGCTGTEKAVSPLGFGPLAKAEVAHQERLDTERQRADRVKSDNARTNLEGSAKPSGPVSAGGEKSVKTGVAGETPAPSTSSSVTAVPGPPSKVSDWLGLWRGKDTTRYQIPSFPPQPMDDPNAKIRVESGRAQQIKFVLIDSSDDKDLCTLSAPFDGNQAKIDPGQPCFGADDDSGELNVRVKSGLGTLRDGTLVLDLTLDAEAQSEQFQARGTVEYHFEGKRN